MYDIARNLRGLILMAFLPSLFGFTLFALLPAWVREALNVNSSDLGILMTMMGVGALIVTANSLTISGALLALLTLAFAFAYPAFKGIE